MDGLKSRGSFVIDFIHLPILDLLCWLRKRHRLRQYELCKSGECAKRNSRKRDEESELSFEEDDVEKQLIYAVLFRVCGMAII